VSQHERCVIRVTIVDEPGETKSDGHKVQLMAVMVTQFPIRLSVYAQQVEDVAAHKVSQKASGGGGGGSSKRR
jgi:hypothetical protein